MRVVLPAEVDLIAFSTGVRSQIESFATTPDRKSVDARVFDTIARAFTAAMPSCIATAGAAERSTAFSGDRPGSLGA